MKRILTIMIASVLASCTSINNEFTHNIDKLISSKNYFEAREIYQENKTNIDAYNSLRIGAILDNKFNKLEKSNAKINKIILNYSSNISDSLLYKFLQLEEDNYAKLGEYEKAYQLLEKILKDYISFVKDTADLEDLNIEKDKWWRLKDISKQKITIKKDENITITKDKIGLSNLPVSCNSVDMEFLFDTGANMSVVTESTAKSMGLFNIEAKIKVGTITGKHVFASLAVAKEFKIGNISISNAVFLVLPDKELFFPQVDYQIHGIVGFPIMLGMKEIQITQKGEFIVPKMPKDRKIRNLAIDELFPIIYLKSGEDKLIYTFDSGATETMLYNNYFEQHKEEIIKKGKKGKTMVGGAGGSIKLERYTINFYPEIAGKQVKLDSIDVYVKQIKENTKYYYGNIGQDLIKKFDKMIMNFEDMYIYFE